MMDIQGGFRWTTSFAILFGVIASAQDTPTEITGNTVNSQNSVLAIQYQVLGNELWNEHIDLVIAHLQVMKVDPDFSPNKLQEKRDNHNPLVVFKLRNYHQELYQLLLTSVMPKDRTPETLADALSQLIAKDVYHFLLTFPCKGDPNYLAEVIDKHIATYIYGISLQSIDENLCSTEECETTPCKHEKNRRDQLRRQLPRVNFAQCDEE